jgi:hypothetical protein
MQLLKQQFVKHLRSSDSTTQLSCQLRNEQNTIKTLLNRHNGPRLGVPTNWIHGMYCVKPTC